MLALMETADKPYYAYPLFWAPFVVVGEGAGMKFYDLDSIEFGQYAFVCTMIMKLFGSQKD